MSPTFTWDVSEIESDASRVLTSHNNIGSKAFFKGYSGKFQGSEPTQKIWKISNCLGGVRTATAYKLIVLKIVENTRHHS